MSYLQAFDLKEGNADEEKEGSFSVLHVRTTVRPSGVFEAAGVLSPAEK